MTKFIIGVLLFSFVWVSNAYTKTIIIPNTNKVVQGSTYGNCFPISCSNLPSIRYQQVYLSSEFRGTTGVIDKIAFRLKKGSSPFTLGPINIEVRLSHTQTTPATMNKVFINNVDESQTLVLRDPFLSLSSSALLITSGTLEFDIILDIDNVFVYNGVDNLLLDIKIFSKPTNVHVGSLDSVSPVLTRAFAASNKSARTSCFGCGRALVTQFIFNNRMI